MKITPEAVKERIAALESADELSLKEQFYLEALRMLVAFLPPVITVNLSDDDIQAFMEAQLTASGGEIRCVPHFVWVRAGDANHASDCTLDSDVAREWEARGLMVIKAPVLNAPQMTTAAGIKVEAE